jgi:hypothetical protein
VSALAVDGRSVATSEHPAGTARPKEVAGGGEADDGLGVDWGLDSDGFAAFSRDLPGGNVGDRLPVAVAQPPAGLSGQLDDPTTSSRDPVTINRFWSLVFGIDER